MKRLIKKIFIFIVLSSFYGEFFGQEFTFKNFNTNDGLPSAEVFHAIQDSKGYIWFATNNGVSRFDGYVFENFDISEGLVNSTVFDLFEDWKGRIWFIALSGRLCYYENGQIKHYKYNHLIDENTKARSIPVKRSFFVDSLDNVYLSITYQGIFKITKQGKISNLMNPSPQSSLSIFSLTEDINSMGYLVDSIREPQISVNGKAAEFKFKLLFHHSSLFFVNKGHLDKEVLFSIDNTIFKYVENEIQKNVTFSSDIIWFSKDRYNQYWCSVRGKGIKNFSSPNFKKPETLWLLKDKDVSSVLIDNENGYWFTTLNNGVFYLPSTEIKTINVPSENSNVLSVEVVGNSIFFGLEDGQLLKYDKKFNVIKQFYQFNARGAPLKLSHHKGFDDLISGTYNLFYLIDYKSRKITRLSGNEFVPKQNFEFAIKCLIAGNGDYFWAGTYGGLFKFSKTELIYQSNTEDQWQHTVYAIAKDSDNSLWLGTFDGLWEYKYGEYINHGAKNKLLSYRINALHKTYDKLFIGTKGRGLIVLNLNDYSTKVVDETDGLSSNSISSIAQYKDQIWIGTNKGVNRLVFKNNELESVSRIDEGSGLRGFEINQILIDENRLYIASRNGFNYLNIDSFNWSQSSPSLHIKSLKINYKDTALQPCYRLKSNQNNIEINYVGISYKSNKNILYKYQLLPFDKKWRITHSTSINYSGLPPGNYEFKILAMNQSGMWSNANSSLKFKIDFPFYKKWWFYLLIGFGIIAIILLLLRNTLKKIKIENKQRLELKRYAQKSIATQLNPHFIFNSLNSLNYLILKNDKRESSKYLAKLSRYLRATFDALQKENLTLNDEIKIVSQYLKLEKLRLKEKLNYEIVLDEEIDSNNHKIPGLFILPLLENALWKRIQALESNGFVKISVEKHEKYIEVLLEDNGVFSHLDEIENGQESFIEQRKRLLNDFYKGQIVFDFIPNTRVSFSETGNIVKLKLLN